MKEQHLIQTLEQEVAVSGPPPDYSVVVPVYNSSEILPELVDRLREVMELVGSSFELVLVEDCGPDESWRTLLTLKKKFPEELTIIKLAKNSGQNAATLCGIRHARGKHVITIDDDLQTPPEEIPKLIRHFREAEADVVYGTYMDKKHSRFRNFGSRMVKLFYKLLVKDSVIGSSFRLLSDRLVQEIRRHDGSHFFLDQIIPWYTPDIEFVEVAHRERPSGKSGYSNFQLFKLAWQLVINHTDIPLRFMIFIGFGTSFLSFLAIVFFIIQKYVVGSPEGFPALIVSIFFATGGIMFCFGIVGEYLNRLYAAKAQKPLYSIKIKK